MVTLNPASVRSLIFCATRTHPKCTSPEGSNPMYAVGSSFSVRSLRSSSSVTTSSVFLVTRASLCSTSMLIGGV